MKTSDLSWVTAVLVACSVLAAPVPRDDYKLYLNQRAPLPTFQDFQGTSWSIGALLAQYKSVLVLFQMDSLNTEILRQAISRGEAAAAELHEHQEGAPFSSGGPRGGLAVVGLNPAHMAGITLGEGASIEVGFEWRFDAQRRKQVGRVTWPSPVGVVVLVTRETNAPKTVRERVKTPVVISPDRNGALARSYWQTSRPGAPAGFAITSRGLIGGIVHVSHPDGALASPSPQATTDRMDGTRPAPGFVVAVPGKSQAFTAIPGGAALWDLRTGKQLRRFSASSPAALSGLAVSPDGTRLACSSTNGVGVWEITGSVPIFWADLSKGSHAVAVSRARVAAVSGGEILVWDLATRQLLSRSSRVGSASAIQGVALSHSGSLLVGSDANGRIHFWRTGTTNEIRAFDLCATNPVSTTPATGKSKAMLSGDPSELGGMKGRTEGEVRRALTDGLPRGGPSSTNCFVPKLALSVDERLVFCAVASAPNLARPVVVALDAITGTEVERWESVSDFALTRSSFQEDWLALPTAPSLTVVSLSNRTVRRVTVIPREQFNHTGPLALSSDGLLVVAVASQFNVWDVEKGTFLRRL